MVWCVIYYADKSLLIVCSVLASADAVKSLQVLNFGDTAKLGALSALGVLILTAFDVWLKPETKYKGYYQANDEYHELQTFVQLFVEPTDKEGIAKAYDEYKQINQRLSAIL